VATAASAASVALPSTALAATRIIGAIDETGQEKAGKATAEPVSRPAAV
jgi:hypothetical protein